MVDPMFMIVQNLGSFLTAVTTNDVTLTILWHFGTQHFDTRKFWHPPFWHPDTQAWPLANSARRLAFGQTQSYSVRPCLPLAATIGPAGRSKVFFYWVRPASLMIGPIIQLPVVLQLLYGNLCKNNGFAKPLGGQMSLVPECFFLVFF